MSIRITKEQKAMCEAGDCTVCGKPCNFRNTAGQCTDCHAKWYRAYEARRKEAIESAKIAGRKYWAERGIALGATLSRTSGDTLTGGLLRRHTYYGTAKVGANGAYVKSNADARQLDPEGWYPVQESKAVSA